MSFFELFLLTFMSFIVRAASIALGDASHPTTSIPTATQPDEEPHGATATNSTSTLTSAIAAAATITSNATAFIPNSQSSSVAILAAVVPVGTVSVTVAAVVFRIYRNRQEQEQREVGTEKHVPAELEAGMIPIELEAEEGGHERYSPRYSK